jgi:hypothetical protein
MVKKPQIDKFREAARALETDEDEAKFDAALRNVAKVDPKGLDESETLGQEDRNTDILPHRKSPKS